MIKHDVSDAFKVSTCRQVLPKKEWLKVFKVSDSLDDPLTKRRWYTYSHHPEFIQHKAGDVYFIYDFTPFLGLLL